MSVAILDAILNNNKLHHFQTLRPPPPLVMTPKNVTKSWYHQKLSRFQCRPTLSKTKLFLLDWLTDYYWVSTKQLQSSSPVWTALMSSPPVWTALMSSPPV